MTANPQPSAMPPTAPPPCSTQPERWFHRAHRAHALVTCVQCPVRRWCAQEALLTKATWGLWAGIWIDGRLSEVAHYLDAIATDTPAIPTAPATTPEASPPARPRARTGL